MIRFDELTLLAPQPGDYRDAVLEQMWDELRDVLFDDHEHGDMTLAEDWAGFPAGTEREEIWHWFDDFHSKGVYYLLYEFYADKSNVKTISQQEMLSMENSTASHEGFEPRGRFVWQEADGRWYGMDNSKGNGINLDYGFETKGEAEDFAVHAQEVFDRFSPAFEGRGGLETTVDISFANPDGRNGETRLTGASPNELMGAWFDFCHESGVGSGAIGRVEAVQEKGLDTLDADEREVLESDFVRAYDSYIATAFDSGIVNTGWTPACAAEFFENEYQNVWLEGRTFDYMYDMGEPGIEGGGVGCKGHAADLDVISDEVRSNFGQHRDDSDLPISEPAPER